MLLATQQASSSGYHGAEVLSVARMSWYVREIAKVLAWLLWCMPQSILAQEASVLATGQWYKLATTQAGVYKIDGAMLQQQGVNISEVKPGEIQLYGYGGGMLPQPLSDPRFADLPEQAIQVVGGEDGRFDPQDYLLFFAQAADEIKYTADSGQYRLSYQKNLYSDTVFYFLTFGQRPGKRMSTQEDVPPAGQIFTSYDAVAVHERDVVNVLAGKVNRGSGREWYGEALNSGQRVAVNVDLTGLLPTGRLQLDVSILSTATAAAAFNVALDGQQLGEISAPALPNGQYDDKGQVLIDSFGISNRQVNPGQATVSIDYQGGSSTPAYLDKLVLQFERRLAVYDGQTLFRNLAAAQSGVAGYRIETAGQAVEVWDITDPLHIKRQAFVQEGNQAVFGATGGQLREYVVFEPQALKPPVWMGAVPNQHLRQHVPDLVIVTHPAWVAEAQRLANFRTTHDGIETAVVTTTQLFNEFSSGAPDLTAIRNYLKYLYDRQPGKLKNVLLLGRSSYDYKDRVDRNTNFVPTYQSRNSVSPIYSYASDDYYGFLEDEEGAWEESHAGDHTMDIGVGRLPVKSTSEAKAVVDKLIHYSTNPATLGQWKSRVLFVADDGDRNLHQRDADRLAIFVDTTYAAYNASKIYTDAYQQQSIPTGEQAPQVNHAIQEAIKKGAFIVNYTGHGNESQWAHESILTLDMIGRWKNLDQLPFFVTATCDFGRQDVPGLISGAERLLLSPQGGAIGMVATARPVFSSTNFLLNKAFYQHVFEQVDGQYQTIGEIFRHTKNDGLSGRVNRNFSLLGDPSMRLAYPQDQITIDQMVVKNPDGTYTPTDTLKALAQTRLSGSVVQYANQQINRNFQGVLYLTVYDKPTTTATRGNGGEVMRFSERKSVIHRGRAQVRDGLFEIDFVVPKNIVYQNGAGKISLYAVQAAPATGDAQGSSSNLQVGGSIDPVPVDNEAPQIRLFMDDTTFVARDVTGTNTTLIAHLSDENGINISDNGLGHGIRAILTKKEQGAVSQTIALNDFYSAEVGTHRQGKVVYPLENLEDGEYMLTLQAWDNMNNGAEENLEFFVQSGDMFVVNSFYNAPNPMTQFTRFSVDHNRPGDDLEVVILIMNMQGQQVFRYVQQRPDAPTRLQDVAWQGRDAYGHLLKPGVYLAKLILRSLTDGSQVEKNHKIIITN